MKISICIVNYNSSKLLEKCLDSIRCFPPDCEFEIIVVDNNSTDGIPSVVFTWDRVRLVENKRNAGFAAGNNQAFQLAKGEYYLLLNPDTEVRKGMFDALIGCADAHPGAGLISARLINPDGTTQIGFNVRRFPRMITAVAQLLLLDEIWPQNPLTRMAGCFDMDYTQVQIVEQPAASALLFRKAVWQHVGGFDEQFLNWYNDVDLCKRVWMAGWGVLFCPSALVMHHGGMGSVSRAVKGAVVESYRSQRLYFRKYSGLAAYGCLNMLIVGGMLLRLAVLKIWPAVKTRVHIRTQQDMPDEMAGAFRAVLFDTLRTWRHLPER